MEREVYRSLGVMATPELGSLNTYGMGRKGLPLSFPGSRQVGDKVPTEGLRTPISISSQHRWEGMILNSGPKDLKGSPKWRGKGCNYIEMGDEGEL